MARKDASILAVFGSGSQAGATLLGACAVRKFREVRVYSPNRAHLHRFLADIQKEAQCDVMLMESPDELVRGADVVLTATSSIDPVFRAGWIEPGMHLGNVRHCEFEDAVYERASRIAIHSHDAGPQNLFIGDPDRDGRLQKSWSRPIGSNWDALPTLDDLFVGKAVGRQNDRDVTCFINNIGIGAQFAVVGAKLLELAAGTGVGRDLPTEWFTQDIRP